MKKIVKKVYFAIVICLMCINKVDATCYKCADGQYTEYPIEVSGDPMFCKDIVDDKLCGIKELFSCYKCVDGQYTEFPIEVSANPMFCNTEVDISYCGYKKSASVCANDNKTISFAKCIYNNIGGAVYQESGTNGIYYKGTEYVNKNGLDDILEVNYSSTGVYYKILNVDGGAKYVYYKTEDTSYLFKNGYFECPSKIVLHTPEPQSFNEYTYSFDENEGRIYYNNQFWYEYYTVYYLKKDSEYYKCGSNGNDGGDSYSGTITDCGTYNLATILELSENNLLKSYNLSVDSNGDLFYRDGAVYRKIEGYNGTKNKCEVEIEYLYKDSETNKIKYSKKCPSKQKCSLYIWQSQAITGYCYECGGKYTWYDNNPGDSCTLVDYSISKNDCNNLNNIIDPQPATQIPVFYNKSSYSCRVDHSKDVSCGYILNNIPKELPAISTLLFNFVKVLTPILLIIKGMMDLVKSVTSQKEEEIRLARKKIMKKLIPAGLVFFTLSFGQFIINLVGTNTEGIGINGCLDCFLNDNCAVNFISEYDDCKYIQLGSSNDTFKVNESKYINIKTNIADVITCNSLDNSIASCLIVNNKLKVTANKNGNTNVYVTSNDITAYYHVTVNN